MPYYLDNAFLLDNPWITVVGCGGTGGFVAEGLCRLFQGREANIVLVDHDRVEPHNLLRQNFLQGDVGKFKSQALADRLAQRLRENGGLLGLPLPGVRPRFPLHQARLPRPHRLRRESHHRLRRQRRSAEGHGGVPAWAPGPLAHRCGQRHQLGTGPRRKRRRSGGLGRTGLRRRDLLPGPRAHPPAARPADGGLDHGRRTWTAPRPSTSPTRTPPSTR